MDPKTTPSDDKQPRDMAYWAQPITTMKVGSMPTGALNLNVEGRQAMSPPQSLTKGSKTDVRTNDTGRAGEYKSHLNVVSAQVIAAQLILATIAQRYQLRLVPGIRSSLSCWCRCALNIAYV
jgi:hypothetical protein